MREPPPGVTPFDPPQSPDEIGRFGCYRVLRPIGGGGMGAVFEAEHVHMGARRALKLMAPQLAADPAARARFLSEARAAAKVRSGHVVAVYDAGECRGVPYIAMELLAGRPLDDHLDGCGVPPLAEAVRIGREAAEGLAAAHAAGLVHRDVKPGNIWLESPAGAAKLIDFGLAADLLRNTRLTAARQGLGTPEYMAPEQVSDARGVDGRADLFGLGVVLYRMTTGVSPFRRDGVTATIGAVLTQTPARPAALRPGLPPALDALILRLLAKDPAARPATARAVADELDRIGGWLAPTEVEAAGSPRSHAGPTGLPPSPSEPFPLDTHPPVGDPLAFTPEPSTDDAIRRRAAPGPRRWAVGLTAGSLFVGVVLAAGVALRGRGPARQDNPADGGAAATTTNPRAGARPPALRAPFTAAEAKAARAEWAAYLRRAGEEVVELPGGVRLELVLVPPGTFTMGSPADEAERTPEEVPHGVEIARPFYLGRYEVTQGEYRAVTGADPSRNKGDRLPAETVSWEDANEFCRRVVGGVGRMGLPTEAEWEYACRAGTTTPFHFGSVLNGDRANCDGKHQAAYGTAARGESLGRPCRVGSYEPNAFGLYDMHGNVWEWCADWYGPYLAAGGPDPAQARRPADGLRVLRGGSWVHSAGTSRAARRGRDVPDYRHECCGFRVCLRPD